ncbi:MAG: hypothetical protein A2148_09600 [Chloroflexi bacterium RBG_16_68_14]|nr:MAG: hypothetical protein A2148_09600 [Chloroflexi bacterium RBG_16_68_14]
MARAEPTVRPAGRDDNQALQELIFRSPQAGRILLGWDRSPDFFARAAPYDESRVFVIDDEAGIAGTVACGLKWVLVQGERQRAAYIFDLAVDARARRRGCAGLLLAEAEAWAREQGGDFLYAHVLGGNRAGLGSFAAAGYQEAARLTSLTFPARVPGGAQDDRIRAVEEEDWAALGRLVHQGYQGHDLLRAESLEGLRALWEGLPGLQAGQVWVVGRPATAVLGLWDYSSVGRAILLRLPPELRALAALSRLLRRLGLRAPRVPRPGVPVRYGLLLGAAGEAEALPALFRRALAQARELRLDTVLWFHDRRTPPSWAQGQSFTGWYHLMAKALHPGPAATLGERPLWVDPIDL